MITLLTVCALTVPTATPEPAAEAASLFAAPRWVPTATTLATAPAVGEMDLDYTYVEAGFNFGDIEGINLEGSYRLPDDLSDFFVSVNLTVAGEADFGPVDLDTDIYGIGGGYIYSVEDMDLDIVGLVQLEQVSVESPGDDETGVRFGVQGRWMPIEDLELNAIIQYRTAFDENEFGFGFGAVYEFYENVRAVADITIQDEFTWFTLGARYSF